MILKLETAKIHHLSGNGEQIRKIISESHTRSRNKEQPHILFPTLQR